MRDCKPRDNLLALAHAQVQTQMYCMDGVWVGDRQEWIDDHLSSVDLQSAALSRRISHEQIFSDGRSETILCRRKDGQ